MTETQAKIDTDANIANSYVEPDSRVLDPSQLEGTLLERMPQSKLSWAM